MTTFNPLSLLRTAGPYRQLSQIRRYLEWASTGFGAPSPHHIKQACLVRNGSPEATWVETGTYLGDTTEYLSRHARQVYSIEPEPTLCANARQRFAGRPSIEILHGTSEEVFPGLLARIEGDVNFWLDGHYSAGVTFKGPQDTPIVDELRCISAHRTRMRRVVVLVDDIRLFDPRLSPPTGYPPLDFLVDWARAERMHWHIEHDIFVARSDPPA